VRRSTKPDSVRRYVVRVANALDAIVARAEAEAPTCTRRPLDLRHDRFIIFSDLHRGARNAADDFRHTERAYRAALAYYLRLGHTLVVLGDAEELWEEGPQAVLEAYRETFTLEAQFHRDGRYVRVWGNHDDAWQFEDMVRRYLQPVYGASPLMAHEAVLLDANEGAGQLGRLLLVHGHQGDAKSDSWSWFSRYVIRYLWRPYQRLTQVRANTPATRYDLRHRLNRAMYLWAEQQSKLVLIAGHTHNPVFRSMSHAEQLELELLRFEAQVPMPHSRPEIEAHALLLSRLEWVRTDAQESLRQANGVTFAKPCYFNTGCCSYDDGDITGIEIVDGEIRLIRWPDDSGEPRPHILASDSLKAVLAAC